VNFKIGAGSFWEYALAYFWAFLVFALLIGTFVVFFMVLFGNIRDRWPHYDRRMKTRVLRNLVLFFGTVGFLIWLGSSIEI
jgi:vacuolar-type H+-ATPase subunit I/STV1